MEGLDLSMATIRETVIPAVSSSPAANLPAPIPGRYEVVIPGWRPPSLNSLMRGNLRARMRIEKGCHRVVGQACREQGVPPATARRRVSLSIGLGPGQREFDRDSPYKALFDSLVACKALVSDRVAGVEIGYLEFYRARQGITTIILEEWEAS